MKNLLDKKTFEGFIQLIDENLYEEGGLIFKETNEIQQIALNFLGISLAKANPVFQSMSGGITIHTYIENRLLYELYKLIKENPQKSIKNILELKYYSSDAFCQKFKRLFGYSATEIRKKNIVIEDNKLIYPFDTSSSEHPLYKCMAAMEEHDVDSPYYDYIEEYEECYNESHFSPDVIYIMAELADKLGFELKTFVSECFDLYCENEMSKKYNQDI